MAPPPRAPDTRFLEAQGCERPPGVARECQGRYIRRMAATIDTLEILRELQNAGMAERRGGAAKLERDLVLKLGTTITLPVAIVGDLGALF